MSIRTNGARTSRASTGGGGGGSVNQGVIQTASGVPIDSTLRQLTDQLGNGIPIEVSINEVRVGNIFKVYSSTSGVASRLTVDAVDSTTPKILSFRTADAPRWALRIDDVESTSNAGSNFYIRRYNDAGVFIDSPITINRATGNIGLNVAPTTSKFTVRGDGTNPIFRTEHTDGTFRFINTHTYSSVNVGNGGSFYVMSNETLAAGPGFQFFVQNFGGTSYIRYAGDRYEIGHVGANNGAFGMQFTMRTALVNTASGRFNFATIGGVAATTGTMYGINFTDTFAAAAGSANYRPLSINYTINNSGAQTGTMTGIFLNATETNLNGMTHNLMDLQVGAVSRFRVDRTGTLTADGSIISTTGSISGAYGAFTLNFSNPRTSLTFPASSSFGGLFLNHSGSIARTSGNTETLFTTATFAAAAGSAVYRHVSLNYTINNSGAQTGSTTGIYLNATETALNSMTHNLMDLQVGGVRQLAVTNTGRLHVGASAVTTAKFSIRGEASANIIQIEDSTGGARFIMNASGNISNIGNMTMNGGLTVGSTLTVPGNTVIGHTSASARLHIRGDGTNPIARFEGSAGTATYVINAAGNVHTFTGEVNISDNVIVASTRGYYWVNRGGIATSGDGIIRMQNNVGSDFNRLQFGGGTSSFPSIKRSSTILQARLADDSDFTFIQGKLRTESNFTNDPAVSASGYLILYDLDGTAYKVLATTI